MSKARKLFDLIRDWPRFKRRLGDVIVPIPFRAGINCVWPRTYLAGIPARYSEADRASLDASGFLAGNREHNGSDLTRFYFLNTACEMLAKEGVPGNVAELGVYKGNTACILAPFARTQGKRLYLFDTFEGFATQDIERPSQIRAFSDTSLDAVRQLVGDQGVQYVVGHFPGSTNQIDDDLKFCLVHIDCDLYEPTAAGLAYFYPRLSRGGMLIIHDYLSPHWPGLTRAVDRFLSDKPERLIPIPDRAGSVALRKL